VIFLDEDSAELENALQANAEMSEEIRLTPQAVKQDFFKRLLAKQPQRFEEVDFTSPKPPARATILDLSCLGDLLDDFFIGEPYLLVREEYKILVEKMKCRKRGMEGSFVLTGQPGIGQSVRVYFVRTLTTAHRQEL
jgi:hypothetical protein